MSTLTALVLATPLFGFALTPPDGMALSPPASLLQIPYFAQLDGVEEGQPEEAEQPEQAEQTEQTEEQPAVEEPAAVEEEQEEVEEPVAEEPPPRRARSDESRLLGAQLRQRGQIADIHRVFGISTWGSMLATVVLGMIQYVNLYGFFGSLEDTPCVRGTAAFGQEQCWGTPWPHLVAASATTALYATTFVLSFVMPDPLGADQGTSRQAENVRLHKTLRWVHFGGMLAQILLGFAVGQNWFGLHRANDFEAMQALATVHQVIGLTTFGVLTAAGAIMIF